MNPGYVQVGLPSPPSESPLLALLLQFFSIIATEQSTRNDSFNHKQGLLQYLIGVCSPCAIQDLPWAMDAEGF